MNAHSFSPSPLAEVTYTAADGRWTLAFVRELAHPPEKVWAALTDPEQLREWAPFLADRNLASPGEAMLTMVDGDKAEDLPASVIHAEAPRLLEYSWADDLLRWELEPTGGGTRLTLFHTLEDQDGLPKAAAGWHLCLDVAARLLDGDPVVPIRGEEAREYGWEPLHDHYAERLGVDVSR